MMGEEKAGMGLYPKHTQLLGASVRGGLANLPTLTAEERKQRSEQARAAKKAKHEARQASTLRRDYLDADLWLTLASERGLRLPPWGEAATVGNLRSWARKAGWTQAQFEDWAGCSIAHFVGNNVLMPLRAMAGIILEVQKDATTE